VTINKTETLNVRLDSRLKAALKEAAELEHRSISNLVEYLIGAHCKRLGIKLQKTPLGFETTKTK